ncbi:TPA: tRNA (adenosine(37)-N6)-dimethylallyltransferase MiaA [Candidatus Gastranaerophilales bacterium HUM_9]|nr:MAG TPA: tRNA (adenosine(37)-N6)-dimethylallyltransferase MiaA [Candidatus Gastranaerophilales bacterium HUM_9]HBX35579.1 tRNA (adenosine(37)-N6)-dimethylallyltransferase MiaA [Cyanobacteria bacterium UBA11440]
MTEDRRDKQKKKVIAIAGPTASGKTKLAIDIAKSVDGEVISADSRLVYKGFNIATAKPTIEEMQGIPHYMIDIVEPEYDFSVADFKDRAKVLIDKITAQGKVPIVAGGTGLYFRILLENFELPKIECNPNLRTELEKISNEELYNELKQKDPVYAEKVHPNNKVRLVRVLEVIRTLNKPFSEAIGLKEPEYDVEWIFPKIESREDLYDRINRRVDMMIDMGVVEETKQLLERHGRIKNLVCTIGYQEIIKYLDGVCSLEDAIEELKMNTRRYAKRQLTWFRRTKELGVNI